MSDPLRWIMHVLDLRRPAARPVRAKLETPAETSGERPASAWPSAEVGNPSDKSASLSKSFGSDAPATAEETAPQRSSAPNITLPPATPIMNQRGASTELSVTSSLTLRARSGFVVGSSFSGHFGAKPPARVLSGEAPYVPGSDYGHFGAWSPEQHRYFKYWRYRFLAGEPVRTDEHYLARLADEGAHFAETLELLVDEWEAARATYPTIRCPRLDQRIGIGRLILGRHSFTAAERCMDLRTSHWDEDPGWIGFDLAVNAGVAPRNEDVAALAAAALPAGTRWRDRQSIMEVFSRVRGAADVDPLLVAATAGAPKTVVRQVFSDVPEIARLTRGKEAHLRIQRGSYGGVTAKIPSYIVTARVKKAVSELVADAASLVVPAVEPTSSTGSEGDEYRMPIRRSRSLVASLPPPDTIDGMLATARLAMRWESVVVLAVVLRMSEVKPWIEGQIAISRDLRSAVDRVLGPLGQKPGLGPLKRGFFHLVAGARAPWTSDEMPADPNLLKMNDSRARFARNLQRELLGSMVRDRVVRGLESVLVERLRVTPEAALTALSTDNILAAKE